MKIAIVTRQFPSLSETFLLNHLKGFLELGYEVDILARFIEENEGFHSEIRTLNLMDRCYSWGEGRGDNAFLRELKAIWFVLRKDVGLFFQCLKLYRTFQNEFQINIFLPVQCFLSRPSYGIILCHYGFIGNLMVHLKQMGVIQGKIVTIFHGADIRWGLKKGAQVYHNLFEESDKMIAVSQYSFQNLIHFGASIQKVVHIPLGIDVDKFRTIRPLRIHKGPYYLVTTTRLVKGKSLTVALEALALFKRRNPRTKFKYLLIGDGPLRRELQQLICDLDLRGDVLLLGTLDQNRIIEHLSRADLFLLPGKKEALPLSVMEAQASGLAVIATNSGSLRDIIVDEESGFLVEPDDPLKFVEKIEYCLDHPKKTHEMGRFGQKIMEQRFDMHMLNYQLNEFLKDLYDELLLDENSSFLRRAHKKINQGVQKIYMAYEIQRDANRLKNHFHQVRSMDELLIQNKDKLRPFYEDFLKRVDVDWMVISLELGAFLLTWCELMRPTKIADLGTGFSSFVFRLYACQQKDVMVVSVDDDMAWLAQTQEFLEKHFLSLEQMMVWDGFRMQDFGDFDLILHDLGPMETREETLPFTLSQLKPGGVCFIDDMHKEDFTSKAKKIIQAAQAEMYTLSHYTMDKYKRYATLAVRSQQAILN